MESFSAFPSISAELKGRPVAPAVSSLRWGGGFQVVPHLAGTGCFETGTPTLTSFSVKIAEVCTDVTGGLQAYHIHPRVGCGVSWGRLEQHRQRSHSFPSTERTCGQTLLTIQFPPSSHCIPHAGQMSWILGLLRTLHRHVCPRLWPRVLCVVWLWHSSILWADHSITNKHYLPILPFCREAVSPGAPSGLPPQELCRGSRGFCLLH